MVFETLLDALEFLGLLFAVLEERELGLALTELVAIGVHSLALIFWPLAGLAVGWLATKSLVSATVISNSSSSVKGDDSFGERMIFFWFGTDSKEKFE